MGAGQGDAEEETTTFISPSTSRPAIVFLLVGSSDEVAEQIIGYRRRLGVNRMILSVHWVGMPHSTGGRCADLFAAEVMPKVKQGM